MDLVQIVASIIFVLAYVGIALEHKLHLNKSAVALAAGGVLWLLASISHAEHLSDELIHAGADVFAIVIFLLAAMSLVEILAHYRFFDVLRGKLYALKLNDSKQFILLSLLAFGLSAIIDNLTTTIIMIQIARQFFKGRNLLLMGAAIVVSANAGGAFSPIGDVTTVMLWFAGKFSAGQIILQGILPAVALWAVATGLMYRKLDKDTLDTNTEIVTKWLRSEKIIIFTVFTSFLLPLAMSAFSLPPYMGLLLGLGVVWLAIDLFKRYVPRETHLTASIEDLIRKTDIASLKFFIGILLSVAALHTMGVLEKLATLVYGSVPTETALIGGNISLGLLSAILDNVPLTAIAIQILNTGNESLWVLLALAVGTGGSLLVIGSAAGVVAMGMLKELNFGNYFKLAFFPALAGYVAAMAVWGVQYFLF